MNSVVSLTTMANTHDLDAVLVFGFEEDAPASTGGGTETYAYDGNGQRVQKSGPSGMTVYVYEAFGQLAAEYAATVTGAPLCQTCYLSSDHLGSVRLVTDQTGNVVSRHDYLPFGEEILAGTAGRNSPFGASDNVSQRFTGKERDIESGLDYFGARYYGSAVGRWITPDPVNVMDDCMGMRSGTLNKYVYSGNNPLKFIDPDGRDITLFYSHEGPAGHAVLYAYDPNNGNSTVHIFEPQDHSVAARIQKLFDIPLQGKNSYGFEDIKSADDLRQHYASFIIQTNPEDTEKAIQIMRAYSEN